MALAARDDAETDTVPWRALFVLGMASFASSAALRFCDPLLPKIADAFSTTPGSAAIVVTTYSVAYGGFQLLTGPLGDRYGKVRVIALGAFLCGFFTLCCAYATNLGQVATFRFLAGVTGAAIIPNCLAFIGDTIPFSHRQPVMARYALFMSMGAISGQAIGGLLADAFGWHAAFVLVGSLLILGGAVLGVQIRINPVLSAKSPVPDGGLRGAFLQILAVRQSSAARLLLGTVSLEAAIHIGAMAFVGAHLRQAYGVSYTAIGLMTALSAAGAASYSLFAPTLLRRFGQQALVGSAAFFLMLSFVLLAITPPLWLVAVALFAGGLGFVLLHNSLQSNATQINPEARGAALSTFAFSFFAGQTLGVTGASWIYDHFGAPPLFMTAAVLMPVLVLWFRSRLGALWAR
jgi:MFS transporter, YNFM family, putative membrane transport protein